MTFKFAHIADVHLGFEQYRLPYRAEEFRKTFETAIKKAVEEKVDFILIAGDLFHRSNPSPQTIKEAIDILSIPKEEGIPVFAIEGNHDRTQKRISAYNLLESLGLMYVLGFSEEKKENTYQTTEKVNGKLIVKGVFEKGNKSLEIYGLKFMSAAWFERNKLSEYFKPSGDAVLMLHQGIKEMMDSLRLETQRDYFEITLEDLPEGFLYYAMGHIHKKWQTNKGLGVVAYPGSLERWDFGDYEIRYRWNGETFVPQAGEDKGFLIVEDFKPRFVKLDVRPFYDVKIKADERAARQELKKLSTKIPKEAFLRVDIEWERPFDVSFLHEIFEVEYLHIRTKFKRPSFRPTQTTDLRGFFNPLELKILELVGEKEFEAFEEVIELFLRGSIPEKESTPNKEERKEEVKEKVVMKQEEGEKKPEEKKIKKIKKPPEKKSDLLSWLKG
ncbi:MAG: DNA double-strand break repair Mre11-like protein [Thermococcales archaeon 44_46]|uniref:DNA double-strand break repair protein Mre11 n=1 Tax=Thermococcus sp. PK TaxID=913025 RepID=UPI0005B25FD4|nr:DNA double-strand break repair protein Mre11 [Thermococcus sp. PK]KUJ99943.1 MAG: DNA double-strand break repair Mre11-like protein [Thermococcales archaeon 44_46]HIH73610.1 exonuclease SbcCD subunit D [Thermococcaceae archaeon]